MSSLRSGKKGLTRRFDHIVRRQRLRTILGFAGFALLIVGVLMALDPFGPPVSNPVAIQKADPHAGIALAQAVASEPAWYLGWACAGIGVVVLLVAALAVSREPPPEDADSA